MISRREQWLRAGEMPLPGPHQDRMHGLQEIAHRFHTPVHVLDLDILRSNYEDFMGALRSAGTPFEARYSIKTNYLPLILEELRRLGAGADVVSGYELEAAIQAGFRGQDIVFNGPFKTRDELARAVAIGSTIIVDAETDIQFLARATEDLAQPIAVGLRLNPGVNVYPSADPTYNDVATNNARRSKFGWATFNGDAMKLVRFIRSHSNLRVSGVHCHLGSQITNTHAFLTAIKEVVSFAAAINADTPLNFINIGGGFGVSGIHRPRVGPQHALDSYRGKVTTTRTAEAADSSLDIASVAKVISALIREYGLGHTKLLCEPGRVLVSDAMLLLATVVSVKRTGQGKWLILDAGLHLLPTAGPGESHRIINLTRIGELASFMVGGPLCYEGDILSWELELPEGTSVGDTVAILDSGAYSVSRSTSFIRPRAGVVARDGEHVGLCWRRETYDDIFAFAEHFAPMEGTEGS